MNIKIKMPPLAIFAYAAIVLAGLIGVGIACDLNVRETGFLNNAGGPYFPVQYKLVMIADGETADFKQLAIATEKLMVKELDGCNLAVALFSADKISQNDRQSMKEDGINLEKLPVTFLFSQTTTGRSIIFTENRLFSAEDVLAMAASPAKMNLQGLLSDNNNYYVIVMLAGSDNKANVMAEKAINAGIKECAPRLAKQKIKLLKVDKTAKAEKAFLKELGVDPGTEPACAVVFGKGRVVTPILKGADITAATMARMFAFLQANASDCTPDAVYLPGSVMDMIMPWTDKLDAKLYAAIAKSGVVPDLVWTEAEIDKNTGELIDKPVR